MNFQPDPKVAEALARLAEVRYDGLAWKHTLPGQAVTAANRKGARRNPANVPAIYLALERDTALAEGRYLAGLQPQPIRGTRHLHEVTLTLERVLDLRDKATLQALGVSPTVTFVPATTLRVGSLVELPNG